MSPRDPDIWQLMFDQTPAIIRFVLGVLTLGIFTIAGVLYKWHRDDLQKVHERVDRLERMLEERHAHVYQRMDEQNRLLIEIAANTRRGGGGWPGT